MLRRLVLTAAASVAALSAVPALPAVAQAGAARAEPVSLSLRPPPARGEDSGDRLTVTVQHTEGGDGTYELRCHPNGGSHPDVGKACATLDQRTTWGKDPFAPVAPGTMCTMMYGGPATAHVTGTWAGRPVEARFDRADGCQIARWDALVPLLPGSPAPPTAATRLGHGDAMVRRGGQGRDEMRGHRFFRSSACDLPLIRRRERNLCP